MMPDQQAKIQGTQILETRERMRKHCSEHGEWIKESLNDLQMFVAVKLVLPLRVRLACRTRLSRAGQSCLVVIRDVSDDWKQDFLLSVVRNPSWRGLLTETVKLRKTQTTGLVEEEVVEEAVVDVDVVEVAEAAVIRLDLLARVKLKLLDNGKKHVDPIAGMEGRERWLELASLVRY
jgi:hypothetical protein